MTLTEEQRKDLESFRQQLTNIPGPLETRENEIGFFIAQLTKLGTPAGRADIFLGQQPSPELLFSYKLILLQATFPHYPIPENLTAEQLNQILESQKSKF